MVVPNHWLSWLPKTFTIFVVAGILVNESTFYFHMTKYVWFDFDLFLHVLVLKHFLISCNFKSWWTIIAKKLARQNINNLHLIDTWYSAVSDKRFSCTRITLSFYFILKLSFDIFNHSFSVTVSGIDLKCCLSRKTRKGKNIFIQSFYDKDRNRKCLNPVKAVF